MRVFISYGHDPNAPLVERIRRDLDAAGHETWIDTSEIKAGEDWRRRIVDGIKGSGWVLAFLSKHSTRDPGVCLDEMAIALHEKAGAIATVLVEDSKKVSAPVTLRHIQHLDMHDWEARQAADPALFETWYRGKLDEILRLLAGPATTQFGGEIEELSGRLRPMAQEADIGPLIGGFVGRDWLLDRLDAWRLGDGGSRLFWLTGAPGSGKSAFAARTAHRGRANVISLSLCRYNADDRRDPARVLRTLAFQLATRLHDYRRLLLDRLRLHDPDGAELARKSPADLLDWLLIQPLHSGIDGGRSRDRLVVVIDALDETVRDGRCVLAELLADAAPRLPEWIALLVTSRPDSPIARQLAGFRQQPIDAASEENQADLEVYARGWLGASGRPDAEVERLVRRIAAASEGNFLYLRKLREGVEAGRLDLAAPEGLPQGLIGLYERWFRHQFPDLAAYEREVLPLLEVIVAAEHPVPEAVLTGVFGWSVRERARRLERLGSLFERRPDGVAPFHKSLRDWLLNEHAAGADYVADATAGRQRLLAFLWQRFLGEVRAGEAGLPDTFVLAELPRLLAGDEGRGAIAALVASGEWVPVIERAWDVARAMMAQFLWVSARAWWTAAACLAIAPGEPGLPWLRVIRHEQGDMERKLGNIRAASESYRASLAIAERLTAHNPSNAQWQRDLSVGHERIGDVLMANGDMGGALASYRAAMTIRERLAAQDPSNAEWQRNLLISHERVGGLRRAQDDRLGALVDYQSALAIAERLVAQDPSNAEWQCDLAASHQRIGGELLAQGDRPGALAAYKACRAITEQLVVQDPSKAEWQRNLAVSYNQVGEVHLDQGDTPGALAACLAGVTIAERLAALDPSNAEWQRDVFVSHNNVSEVLLIAGDPAAREHARLALGQARLWAERFPQDPRREADLRTVENLMRRTGGDE